MALITFPSGFSVSTNDPIDGRLVMTKAEMLAAKSARMPQVYFTVCKDDGNMYIYNINNTVDEETGRFRSLSSTIMNKSAVETIVSSDPDNMIVVMEDGLKVSEPDSIPSENITDLFTE